MPIAHDSFRELYCLIEVDESTDFEDQKVKEFQAALIKTMT